jgi:hypothetical protein
VQLPHAQPLRRALGLFGTRIGKWLTGGNAGVVAHTLRAICSDDEMHLSPVAT